MTFKQSPFKAGDVVVWKRQLSEGPNIGVRTIGVVLEAPAVGDVAYKTIMRVYNCVTGLIKMWPMDNDIVCSIYEHK